jgi:transcriptional regulator with XRE-family HTH domain
MNVTDGYILVKPKRTHMVTDFSTGNRHNVAMSENKSQYFKEWRKFRGLTQEAAADLTGLARAYISQLESEAKRHNADILDKFAAAYMCEPWELIGKNPLAPDDASDIVGIWDHIPARNRQQARQILETFTDKKKA